MPTLGIVSLQHALTRELLVADSVEEAAPVYLSAIGTLLSWDAGALWEVPQHGAGTELTDDLVLLAIRPTGSREPARA
jgi:hypothetical protein